MTKQNTKNKTIKNNIDNEPNSFLKRRIALRKKLQKNENMNSKKRKKMGFKTPKLVKEWKLKNGLK